MEQGATRKRGLTVAPLFLHTFSNWWYKHRTMQDVPHILERLFETSFFYAGLVCLFFWRAGRKRPTNLEAFYIFAVLSIYVLVKYFVDSF